MTIKLSYVRASLKKHPSYLWVLINTFGFFIVNDNYVGFLLQNHHVHPTLMLIYFYIVSPLFSGLIFGVFQFCYIKFLCKTLQLSYWALKTSFSFFLINLVNGYLPSLLLLPFIWKVVGVDFSYTANLFTGNVITGSSEIILKVFVAIFLGILMGLWSGFILGFFPAISFSDKVITREWILYVTIAGCLSFVINSVYYTLAFNQHPTEIHLLDLYRNGFLITGLIYGLLTRNIIRKLVREKNN